MIDIDSLKQAPVAERRAILTALNERFNANNDLATRQEFDRAAWRLLLPYWQDETRH
jgi:hypothetical protein